MCVAFKPVYWASALEKLSLNNSVGTIVWSISKPLRMKSSALDIAPSNVNPVSNKPFMCEATFDVIPKLISRPEL